MKQILLSLIILIIIITIILLFYSIKYKKEKFLNFDFVPESIDFVKKNGAFYENQPIYSDDNPANNNNNKIVIELPQGLDGIHGQPAVCPSDCSNPDACNGSSCKGQPGDPGIPKCLIKAGEPGLQGFAGRKGDIGVKGQDIQPIQAPRGRQGPPGKTGNPGISYATLHGQNGQKGASGAMGLDARPQYMDDGTGTKVQETYPGQIFESENKKPIDFMSNSVEGADVVLGYNLGNDNRHNFDVAKVGYVTEKKINDIDINLSVPYMQSFEFELSISGEISLYQGHNYFTINIPNFKNPPFDNYKDMLIFCSWNIDDSLAVYHKNSKNEILMITDIVTDKATDTPNSYWYNTIDKSEKFTTKIIDNNKIYIYYKTENLAIDNKAKIICFYFNND